MDENEYYFFLIQHPLSSTFMGTFNSNNEKHSGYIEMKLFQNENTFQMKEGFDSDL